MGWRVRHHYPYGVRRVWLSATLFSAMVATGLGRPAIARRCPTRPASLPRCSKRLASNDLIQSRYSFRERSTEVRLNPFGAMGTGPEMVYEVYPHPSDELTYKRLVERDGRPLTTEEIARTGPRPIGSGSRPGNGGWRARATRSGLLRLRKAQEERLKDEARAREALDMFDFAIAGRDTWEGQPAIIVTFTPKAHTEPRSREGRIASAFAGRVWVHEFDTR